MSADEWNRVRRIAEAFTAGGEDDARVLRPGVILVRNDGNTMLPDRAAVGIGTVVNGPESAGDVSFRGTIPCFTCNSFAANDSTWGILLSPLASGEIGRAVVFGIVLARIVWNDDAGPVAGPMAGSVFPVAGNGGARILWADENNAVAHKPVWALISIGMDEGSKSAVPAKIRGFDNGVYSVDLYKNGPASAKTGTGYLVLPEVQQFTQLAVDTWVLAHAIPASLERTAEEEVLS